jgi:alkyl sulfatase BDS1-like metallo-beta-lactamase superfamily hydrolase
VWSTYLTEAIETFGPRTDVAFASHHWPTWGSDRVTTYLATQRDLYAYLHDQTLRLLNQGFNGAEIAEMIELPPALENAWNTHGYYGSVSHNVKAIYQRYMGWFDGNPARLWPHPPAALAERYVSALGGIDRVVELAQTAYDAGDYRWAATLLDHAIFADEHHASARTLYVDTLEQLGYGSENGTWRNFFLSGATELREGKLRHPGRDCRSGGSRAADARAGLRRHRDLGQRAAGVGPRPVDRCRADRPRTDLSPDPAQRRPRPPRASRRRCDDNSHPDEAAAPRAPRW